MKQYRVMLEVKKVEGIFVPAYTSAEAVEQAMKLAQETHIEADVIDVIDVIEVGTSD